MSFDVQTPRDTRRRPGYDQLQPMRPSLMRDEGWVLALPTLCGRPIFLSWRISRRRPIYVGWGRQFANSQPWWAYFGMWRHRG